MASAPHHHLGNENDDAATILALRAQLLEKDARIAELTGQMTELTAAVARLSERVEELLVVVGRQANARKAPKESTPAPPPAPPHLDDEARAAYDNRPKPPEPKPKPEKTPKKRASAGRNKLPENLPRDEAELKPASCPECGSGDLVIIKRYVEEKLHAVREHQRVRRTVRVACECNACSARVLPDAPPAPYERSKATCEWLAWFIWFRHALLVPLDRIRRDLQGKGVPLAMSYLVSQVERAADLLAPIDGEHWKQLLRGNWMAMDATGLKVCIDGVPGTHGGYLEAFHNGETVVIQYEPTKQGPPLASKLAPFKGVLVADAEHRHNALFESGTIIEAGCNAHGRRKLRDAEQVQPALAAEGGRFISAIFEAEAEAKARKLSGDALRDWRQAKCGPHFAAFKAWSEVVKPTLLPTDPLRKVLAYYDNHWAALTRFLEHPEIPMDNSGTERLYQPVAKLRHNILFAGSTEGAHRLATLLGIVATCRALGVDGEAYLACVFTRLGTHRDRYGLKASELTPAAYAARARDGTTETPPTASG